MNKQKTHIDDMLKQLDEHQLRGTADAKAAFMKKAGRHSFLKFYPGRFNLYYLIAGIALITGASILISSQTRSATPQYQKELNIETLKNKHLFIETDTPETNQIPDQQTNSEIIEIQNEDFSQEVISSEPETTIAGAGNHEATQISMDKQIIIESEETEDQIIPEDVSKETAIIYDTVLVDKHVKIQDTIRTQVTDTIKIKDKQRRRRR